MTKIRLYERITNLWVLQRNRKTLGSIDLQSLGYYPLKLGGLPPSPQIYFPSLQSAARALLSTTG